MKPLPLLIALGLPGLAAAGDFDAWTHRQTLRVTQPGLTRVALDPALLDASRAPDEAPFQDLRVVSPDGVETPRIIALPRVRGPGRLEAAGFKVMLAPRSTVLEFQQRGRNTIREIVLRASAVEFIKAARVEAGLGGSAWQTLSVGEVLCRQNGTERLRLPVTPAAWTHFRITIDDARGAPVAFTGAELVIDLPELRTVPHDVIIRSRSEENGVSRLVLDLGASHVMLGAVRVRTTEPVFRRGAALLNARGTLFRFQHEDFTGEEVEIQVHQLAATREVELILDNGDSPPLRIDGIEATRHAIPLVFQAKEAGNWQLFIGNAQAPVPRYDIEALGDKLRDAVASGAALGTVEANPAFLPTATAPVVGEPGAVLDVAAWTYQREILFPAPGVIELELDAAVIGRAANDLRDLRVIREGRQIPFLVIRPDGKREVELSFAEINDLRETRWSKWEIETPFPNFPATELLLGSPTPLFVRSLTVTEVVDVGEDRRERVLGSATWQRKPGDPTQSFRLPLRFTPRAGVIRIATDNGVNAPLKLDSVRASFPVVKLLFRMAGTEPARLCYGNSQAAHARYDLDLVRREFEAAVKIPGTLGEEVELSIPSKERVIEGAGSPWLWAALALVVASLLWIVARMLPREPS